MIRDPRAREFMDHSIKMAKEFVRRFPVGKQELEKLRTMPSLSALPEKRKHRR